MGTLTDDTPKPMLPVAGRPLLAHVVERLRAAGIEDLAIVIGYRGDLIRSHFEGQPGIHFLEQTVLNGTGAAALLARDFVGTDDFLFTFGDILTESTDYQAMISQLSADPTADAVAAVRWVDDPFQGAAVYVDPHRTVTRIVEKPARGTSTTHWNSAGVYAFRPGVFAELDRIPLSPRGEYEVTSAVESLVSHGKVVAHVLEGLWRDVGRPEDLAAAQAELAS